MKKKTLIKSILLSVLLVLPNQIEAIQAAEPNNQQFIKKEKKEESIDGNYMIDHIFRKIDSVFVMDEKGNDITQHAKKVLKEKKSTDSVKEYLADNQWTLYMKKYSDNESSHLMGYSTYRNVSEVFVRYLKSTSKGVPLVLEVGAELHGGVWTNENTGKVTAVSNPVFKITYMNAGAGATIRTNNLSAGSYITKGRGYFWGRCSFDGVFKVKGNGKNPTYVQGVTFGPMKVAMYS